ncbi:MAG: hypothetical protein ACR2LN_04245 [Candidatus Levyibacteriota bacterium]
MQTLNQFFGKLLQLDEKRKPSKAEQTLINKGQLLDVIFQRITSTQFRRSSLDKDTPKAIKTYLKKAIVDEKPLRLYFLFGGYKQARLQSAPYPEWAELFNISFMLKAASYTFKKLIFGFLTSQFYQV